MYMAAWVCQIWPDLSHPSPGALRPKSEEGNLGCGSCECTGGKAWLVFYLGAWPYSLVIQTSLAPRKKI